MEEIHTRLRFALARIADNEGAEAGFVGERFFQVLILLQQRVAGAVQSIKWHAQMTRVVQVMARHRVVAFGPVRHKRLHAKINLHAIVQPVEMAFGVGINEEVRLIGQLNVEPHF